MTAGIPSNIVLMPPANLLDSDADALVNTVNTVGVMGAGIAKQFKLRYPEMYLEYRRRCLRGEVVRGRIDAHVVFSPEDPRGPRYVFNAPTKEHWRNPSSLELVSEALAALVPLTARTGLRSIAVPPLGCGLGGLDWDVVRPMVLDAFAQLPDVAVSLYEPA